MCLDGKATQKLTTDLQITVTLAAKTVATTPQNCSVMTDKIELHGLLSLSHVSCVLYHVALDSCSHCVATLVLPLPVTLLYIRLSVLSVFRFANINSHNILLSISHWRQGWDSNPCVQSTMD